MSAWLDTMIMGLWLGFGIGCGAMLASWLGIMIFGVWSEFMEQRK